MRWYSACVVLIVGILSILCSSRVESICHFNAWQKLNGRIVVALVNLRRH